MLGRLLRDAGIQVTLLALADPDTLTGDAAQAAGDYRAAGGVVVEDPVGAKAVEA